MALVWNGDVEVGDMREWGGFEYGGTFDGTPKASDRLSVVSSKNGITPPQPCKNMIWLGCAPDDEYGGTTGARALLRQGEPIPMRSDGYDSWLVWAELFPTGFPFDANIWVAGNEVHQTKASYVSVTGVAPAHHAAGVNNISFEVAGGRDGARVIAYSGSVPNYSRNSWHIFAMRYRHGMGTNGAYELWHGELGRSPLTQIVSKSGISTMYEGTQNYLEIGLYRALSGIKTIEMYLAGVREYKDPDLATAKKEALDWAGALLGGAVPVPPPTTTTTGVSSINNGDALVGPTDWTVTVTGPADTVQFFVNNIALANVVDANNRATYRLDPAILKNVTDGGFWILKAGVPVYKSQKISFTLLNPPSQVDVPGALADTKNALANLRASSGYKNAKRDNPNPASFAGTYVGKCETQLIDAIVKLSG